MSCETSVFVLVMLLCCSVTSYNITDLQRLKTNLLVDRVYDKTIRPVVNQSHIVEIEIALAVTSIVHFDMVSGRIGLSGFLLASWTDEQLQWNPLDYNGISKVLVSKDSIWTPGLRNAFDLDDKFAVSRVNLYPNGHVVWLPANEFYSICLIDITLYPYDEHECPFPIFSSSDDESTIKFVPLSDKVNLNNFNKHGEWDVVRTQSEVYDIIDPQIKVKASSYLATMTLKRRPRFAILHTYFPLLLITCLNILSFMVPLDKGERVSFSITLLLALVFFTSNLSETLPKSSLNTSYFSATMTLAICASTVAVMLSIILVKIDAETIRPVPQIFQRLVAHYKSKQITHSKNNTICVLQNNENDDSLNELKTTNVVHPDTIQNKDFSTPNEHSKEAVTWSDVAYLFNKICMFVYSVLLGASLLVLIVLHHP